MGTVVGYVILFEASDSASGDPNKTSWKFVVDPGPPPHQVLITKNSNIAETMKFAIQLNNRVFVQFADGTNVIEWARVDLHYICEQITIQRCSPGGVPSEVEIHCVTRRLSPCRPRELPHEG